MEKQLVEIKKTVDSLELLQRMQEELENIKALDNAMANCADSNGEIPKQLVDLYNESILNVNNHTSTLASTLDDINVEINKLKKIKDEVMAEIKMLEKHEKSIKDNIINAFPQGLTTSNYTISVTETKSLEPEEGLDINMFNKCYPELTRVKYELDKVKIKNEYSKTGILPNGVRIEVKDSIRFFPKSGNNEQL